LIVIDPEVDGKRVLQPLALKLSALSSSHGAAIPDLGYLLKIRGTDILGKGLRAKG
jgi:hypothetical protein